MNKPGKTCARMPSLYGITWDGIQTALFDAKDANLFKPEKMEAVVVLKNTKKHILKELKVICPFPEIFEHTELLDGSSIPVPVNKIGHIRADHDGYRWWNTVWPCHRKLAVPEARKEIDEVYDALTAKEALRDLPALQRFCAAHMEACVSKEYQDEFSFFYEGKVCDFWIRLITRKGDYNLYLNAFAKMRRER